MKTYPTYQEAKIAHPDYDVFHYGGKFYTEIEINMKPAKPCNPADYCMTVKQFLDAEYKFVEGDKFLMDCGAIYTVGVDDVSEDTANHPAINDNKRYVLKAKVLKEAKPDVKMNTFETMKHNIPEGATHYIDGDFYFFDWVNLSEGKYYNEGEWLNYEFSTIPEGAVKPIPTTPTETQEEKEALDAIEKTYRYEKVTDSIFDLKAEFERGDLFHSTSMDNFALVRNEHCFSEMFCVGNIYRRIEVTERELFIAEFNKTTDEHFAFDVSHVAGKLFDAGCRFVNGKG